MEFKPGAILTKDNRDFSLEKAHELLGTVTLRPEEVKPIEIPQVFQSGWPACGAHSGVHLKQVQEKIETGLPIKLSPAYLWKKIKQIDGFAPEVGTDMRSIFKCLAKDGVCDYALLPNDYSLSLADYTSPTAITEAMNENAQPRIISSYAFATDLSMDNLKTQIWLNKAVLLLIRCDDGFFRSKTPTFTKKDYGHFVVAIGYNKDGIYVQDSTQEKYPVKFIKNEYAPFIIQAGTAIDLPNKVVEELKLKLSLMQKIVELYKKLRAK